MKKVTEATRTVEGVPIKLLRFMSDDESGYPWIGVYWNKYGSEWEPTKWDDDGYAQVPYEGVGCVHLDLSDWRDGVPWGILNPQIKAIAWEPGWKCWLGFMCQPILKVGYGWVAPGMTHPIILGGLYLPFAPNDWMQTLVVRPDFEGEI